ncbi:expansin-like protein [Dactylonectria estremocensis]|uniref:Expansin-like protein n=1 Tax=Dactylonectria estremocensis TaxID=1079267 RepID=A0A9P9EUR5_9HYPO|nr:expansin-like protein [Dactylonectria estremocensis]
MSALLTTIVLALMLPLASAAPSTLQPRTSGDVTFYNPSVGTGACGKVHSDDSFVVAVSAPLFDSIQPCGKSIKVTGPAGTAVVLVVDRCGGCAYNDLDLSPAAFKQVVGDLGIGRTMASWEWA